MSAAPVHKKKTSRAGRLLRLVASLLDPRAFAHMFKVVNYYNYTHVAELRKATRGRDLRIGPTVSFANGQNITLGDRVRVGAGASLWAGSGTARIVIGDDSMIAPGVMMTAANYRYGDGSPVHAQAMDEADIIVGCDVWIGSGSLIMAGVTIGDGAIVGAGSVVRGDVAANAIVAGNPAKSAGFRTAAVAGDTGVLAHDAPLNAQIMAVIRRELNSDDTVMLTGPLAQSGVDSFGLISLRTAVEVARGVDIPDREWSAITTIADIARLGSLQGAGPLTPDRIPAVAPSGTHVPVERMTDACGRSHRTYTLDMPQMALSGLSEAWLFKEMGDIHWAMITAFLQTPSSAIVDDVGDRLYATFTRLAVEASGTFGDFRENETLAIASTLERFGASLYFGTHKVTGASQECTARTMSTFAKYGEHGKNTSLIKGTPLIPQPQNIPSLTAFPDFSTGYRDQRSAEPADVIFECDYDILPSHDINGVGLLYFAAYTSIFDICIERHEGKGFLIGNSTVSKDILYFANSAPNETLVFRLHQRDETPAGIRHVASLWRKSDLVRMAQATSVKRSAG